MALPLPFPSCASPLSNDQLSFSFLCGASIECHPLHSTAPGQASALPGTLRCRNNVVATFEHGCMDTFPNFLALWNTYTWTVPPFSSLHHSLFILPYSRVLDVGVVLGVSWGRCGRVHTRTLLGVSFVGPQTPFVTIFLSRSCPDWACSSTNPPGGGASHL